MGSRNLLPKVIFGVMGLSFLLVIILALVILIMAWWSQAPTILGFNDGPKQPIAFPHTVHVQQAGLDCQFCHRTVTTDEAAGIPAVQQCMFCHNLGRIDGTLSESDSAAEEIGKLRLAYLGDASTDPQPINWVRVHRLPDHVQFVHSPHIKAGFACSTCHGDIAGMEKVRQVRNLKMRDCVDCHRQNNAPTDCATCHY